METRHIDTMARLSRTGAHLWYHPVQIRRRGSPDHRGAWSQFSPVLSLGLAIRDSLKLLEKESVTIHFVQPRMNVAKIDEIDILALSRRADYPFRDER